MCRRHIATAVAFPQKSESTIPHQKPSCAVWRGSVFHMRIGFEQDGGPQQQVACQIQKIVLYYRHTITESEVAHGNKGDFI